MNKNRLIYILFVGFTIVLGLYRDGYVSTMLFYMAILIPVASFGHLLFTYTQFRLIESLDRKSIVKGDTVIYQYEITNYTHFVFCPIRVKFTESEILFKDSVLAIEDQFILYPGETRIVKKEVDCKYRGFYYIGIDYIHLLDFLGIFSLRFRISEHQKILVFPLIRELMRFKFARSIFEESESIASNEKDNASVFSDVREYRSGDSLKHIHWKMSSKKNQLMTKEFEGSSSNKTTIMMNVDGLPFEYEQNIVFQDYMIEGTVAVIKNLLDNNAKVTMVDYKMSLEKIIGSTKVDFGLFYNALAKMMFSQTSFVDQLLTHHFEEYINSSQVLIFIPYITKEIEQFFTKTTMNQSNLKFLIVDPKEQVLDQCFKQIDLDPLYGMIAKGFTIYKINFENGMCRLDVA